MTSLISIFLLVVGILFIHFSQKKNKGTSDREFYVVHGSDMKFPFDVEVPRGSTYLDVLAKLEPTKSIEHIYFKNGKAWEEVDKNDYIDKDQIIKIRK